MDERGGSASSSKRSEMEAVPGQTTDPQGKRKRSIFEYTPQDPKAITSEIIKADCMNHGYRLTNRTLGEGAYAKVKVADIMTGKLARNKTLAAIAEETGDFQVAIKIIEKRIVPKEFLRKFLPRELSNHTTLPKHEHVVRIYEHFSTPEHLFLVMELCQRGDLLDLINKSIGDNQRGIGEELARKVFEQMCKGVRHIHKMDIVHRDLKCENILLTDNFDAKVTDFGFSCKWADRNVLLRTSCGSYAYTAPEVIKNKPYDGNKSDTWSMGIILFAMVNGRLPFNDSQLMEMDEDMRMQRLRFERHVSFECMVLIRKILQYNPCIRATLDEILSDPWITGKKPIPRQIVRPKWVNPYCAKKDTKSNADDISVDTQTKEPPVAYEMVSSDQELPHTTTPTSTVTVSQENREVITLKSRNISKRNIRTIGPPNARRPNTWPKPTQPQEEKGRTCSKGESTQQRRERYAERYSQSYMVHLLNMYRGSIDKDGPVGTSDVPGDKNKDQNKTLPGWFIDKILQTAGKKPDMTSSKSPGPTTPSPRRTRSSSNSRSMRTAKTHTEPENEEPKWEPITGIDTTKQHGSNDQGSRPGSKTQATRVSPGTSTQKSPRKSHSSPKSSQDSKSTGCLKKTHSEGKSGKECIMEKFMQMYGKCGKNYTIEKNNVPALVINSKKLVNPSAVKPSTSNPQTKPGAKTSTSNPQTKPGAKTSTSNPQTKPGLKTSTSNSQTKPGVKNSTSNPQNKPGVNTSTSNLQTKPSSKPSSAKSNVSQLRAKSTSSPGQRSASLSSSPGQRSASLSPRAVSGSSYHPVKPKHRIVYHSAS